ncbi:MAG: S41 family peptidase [Crocinitomicaceae bacterium]|nr:S41 family peptidase [Crocinitomicaceae bacterium]
MKPKPKTDNISIFNEYAKLVKEKYAMLEFKNVDIDFLTDSIAPSITNEMSTDSLFSKLAIITKRLRDGHSSLIGIYVSLNMEQVATFDILAGYPIAFNDTILQENYVGPTVAPSIKRISVTDEENSIDVIYGTLPQDNQLSYIRIPSFNIQLSDEQLETIFSEIKGSTGCIIDVRGNGGGNPSLSTKFASYFMSETTYTGYERFKIGPNKNDFKDSPSNVTPANSENRYTNPVVVLTDRGCYSATTTLAYNLNPLSQVTFMGQRTGGGSGSVADGFLANGWQWSLSTSEFIDHLGNHLDDGINPDIEVAFDNLDKTHDEILDAAIAHLQ